MPEIDSDRADALRSDHVALFIATAKQGERIRDLEGDRDEMKAELKEIRSLSAQIRGGVILLGILWAFATFVVPLVLRR